MKPCCCAASLALELDWNNNMPICSLALDLPSAPTYYWSMVLAGSVGLLRFLWDARAWRAELRAVRSG